MTNPTDAVTAPPVPSSPSAALGSEARSALRRLVGRDDADFRDGQLEAVTLRAPSPFALALMVERYREQLSTEKLADRLARLLKDANAAVDRESPAPAG